MNAMESQLPNSWDFAQRCIRLKNQTSLIFKPAALKFERQREFREPLLRKIYITICIKNACLSKNRCGTHRLQFEVAGTRLVCTSKTRYRFPHWTQKSG